MSESVNALFQLEDSSYSVFHLREVALKIMKPAAAKKAKIRVAVVESDPLRFIGFRSLFDSEQDLELVSHTLPELGARSDIDLVLLGSRNGQNLFDLMAGMKAARPDLGTIVTGKGADDETILHAAAA